MMGPTGVDTAMRIFVPHVCALQRTSAIGEALIIKGAEWLSQEMSFGPCPWPLRIGTVGS